MRIALKLNLEGMASSPRTHAVIGRGAGSTRCISHGQSFYLKEELMDKLVIQAWVCERHFKKEMNLLLEEKQLMHLLSMTKFEVPSEHCNLGSPLRHREFDNLSILGFSGEMMS